MHAAPANSTPATPGADIPAAPNAAAPNAASPNTAGWLRELLGAELFGNADAPVRSVAAIDQAHEGDVTFIRSAKYAALWDKSGASVAVVHRELGPPRTLGDGRAVLLVDDTDAAQLRILTAMAPQGPSRAPGIDASARVSSGASVHPEAFVGPMCVIEEGALVGPRSVLVANVYVGPGARVGEGSRLGPHTTLHERCVVGNHCSIGASVVIGGEGFGYSLQQHPSGRGKYLVHIPHLGNVVIGDHVDIGSGTCIDRAKFGSTTIGSGTKIDNLVQIGHNCRIGRSCIICGHVGLSGSVTLGDGVQLGGKVGIADNITIGAMSRIGASAGVMNDVPPNQTWLGTPAGPAKETARNLALLRKLSTVLKKMKVDAT